jgi:hypothetical protein
VLRQQINVLQRAARKRLLLSGIDRLIFIGLFWLFLDLRGALTIVKLPSLTSSSLTSNRHPASNKVGDAIGK